MKIFRMVDVEKMLSAEKTVEIEWKDKATGKRIQRQLSRFLGMVWYSLSESVSIPRLINWLKSGRRHNDLEEVLSRQME